MPMTTTISAAIQECPHCGSDTIIWDKTVGHNTMGCGYSRGHPGGDTPCNGSPGSQAVSNSLSVCTCPIDQLMTTGCRCGHMEPYRPDL